jgi:hypothetical protein
VGFLSVIFFLKKFLFSIYEFLYIGFVVMVVDAPAMRVLLSRGLMGFPSD